MDDVREHPEHRSRPDRWGSHSFGAPSALADQIERVCGRGPVLDVGCGTGLLVRTLAQRGVEARGVDIVRQVVDEGNRLLPGHFHFGSILKLPFADEAFATVLTTGCLEYIAEEDLPQALRELHRVSSRFAFIQLATTPDRRRHVTLRDRVWWENHLLAAGFRRHPLTLSVLRYEDFESLNDPLVILLEKISDAALQRYPLEALRAQRDLHMDMLRESGRRADAHLARYALAADLVPQQGVVVDAASGLGYGSAMLAAHARGRSVIGIDNSPFAVEYATVLFASGYPQLQFRRGDVCHLAGFATGSVAAVVSFETLEHLPDPREFLAEVERVLQPGGFFVASVPNLWVDEEGNDPNPWHFQVFDCSRLLALCGDFLDVDHLYAQTAGGGMKLPHARRRLDRVRLPVTNGEAESEWWVLVARKPQPAARKLACSRSDGHVLLMTGNAEHPNYASWTRRLPFPLRVVDPSRVDACTIDQAVLVVTHDTYTEPGRSAIQAAIRGKAPVLILADGILEYRNTWEHPQLEPGAIFQPVLGHKVATIGPSQTRILESWGNRGRCETVGLPRLDRYFGLKRRERGPAEPFKLLICTALTPYFTVGQHQLIRASLADLKDYFESNTHVCGVPVQPIWRLTQRLAEEIGAGSQPQELLGKEMSVLLQGVDAVITTPSTVLLESMLLGLPTAALDYCNTPNYVSTAWRITADRHIPTTLAELVDPPEPKLLFQETELHDALECDSPATPRIIELIERMVEVGREFRRTGDARVFDQPLLARSSAGRWTLENRFRLDRLYPKRHEPVPGSNLPGRATWPELAAFGTIVPPTAAEDLAAELGRARELLAAGHALRAQTRLESVVARFPWSSEAWLELARTLQDDRESAVRVLERGVTAVPRPVELYEVLAAFEVQLGRFERAEIAARRGLELNENNGDLLRLFAMLREHEGDLAAAAAAYERLLKLVPQDPTARLGKARCAAFRGHRVLAELLLDELCSDPTVGEEARALLNSLPRCEVTESIAPPSRAEPASAEPARPN